MHVVVGDAQIRVVISDAFITYGDCPLDSPYMAIGEPKQLELLIQRVVFTSVRLL